MRSWWRLHVEVKAPHGYIVLMSTVNHSPWVPLNWLTVSPTSSLGTNEVSELAGITGIDIGNQNDLVQVLMGKQCPSNVQFPMKSWVSTFGSQMCSMHSITKVWGSAFPEVLRFVKMRDNIGDCPKKGWWHNGDHILYRDLVKGAASLLKGLVWRAWIESLLWDPSQASFVEISYRHLVQTALHFYRTSQQDLVHDLQRCSRRELTEADLLSDISSFHY
jgi:hypothetical protein